MGVGMELFSPIQSIPENDQRGSHMLSELPNFNKNITQSSVPYGIDDMSTWIGGKWKLTFIVDVNLQISLICYINSLSLFHSFAVN